MWYAPMQLNCAISIRTLCLCMALFEWMIWSQGVARSHHWGAGHHHGASASVTIVHRPDQLMLLLFCILYSSQDEYEGQIIRARHHNGASFTCSVTNQTYSKKTIQTPKYSNSFTDDEKSKLKLGKSYRATYICQYQSESDGSESERFQPGVKSIFKPSSFGVKTEQILLDAVVAAYIFFQPSVTGKTLSSLFLLSWETKDPRLFKPEEY